MLPLERLESLVSDPRRAALLADLSATVVLEVRDDAGTVALTLSIDAGRARVQVGGSERPDVVVRVHAGDWDDLSLGYASWLAALRDGRLLAEGDLALMHRVAPALFGSVEADG